MPATSRAQFRLFQAAAHGSVKIPGLSRKQAAEYVAGQSPKGLPERSGKKVPRTAKTPKVRRK